MKRPVQHKPATLQRMIEDFNLKFSVGEKVNVKLDDGTTTVDIIRHPATIMGGHTAMAWLEQRGSFLLQRVSKI